MNKQLIAIFFSIIFLSLITVPSIIMAIDDTADLSYVYSISEEEETSHFKLTLVFNNFSTESLTLIKQTTKHEYFDKCYAKPHLNIIFPPPEIA